MYGFRLDGGASLEQVIAAAYQSSEEEP